jgi:hypothetical protein
MSRDPGVTTAEKTPKPGDAHPAEDRKQPSHSLDDQTVPSSDSNESTEAATWRGEIE